ncbi:MAG TPA: 3-keto-5-aminohexanoate cleavage protein [Xanthobacteraceae bacterium]|jgi:hypothetical protein|nr:3-keto-5-aminohexanoate cleavage protein [Xanthobacteraceae bacterium]
MNNRNRVILGCASTGAKFTPLNHRKTGDKLLDEIYTGVDIPVRKDDIALEAKNLYEIGVRYYHYHARNFFSREQSTDNTVYQAVSRLVQSKCPDMLISFGASRNGSEIQESIRRTGEWERVSQCAIPVHLGGAHFVTIQAAIELQIIRDLERRFKNLTQDLVEDKKFAEAIRSYIPSRDVEEVTINSNSTARGSNYGASSAHVQFETYRQALEWRNRMHLLHEVEWVQFVRSYAMTRFAIEHPWLQLGGSGQLNITLLFGFSPKLPFPANYAEFKQVVNAAKRLEFDIGKPEKRRNITISAGAAVIPDQAAENFKEVDVGPFAGEKMCALRRLAVYAAQPDSGVDIFRFGMEDTPYEVDGQGQINRTTNVRLGQIALAELQRNGVEAELDAERISDRLGLTSVCDAYLETLKTLAIA